MSQRSRATARGGARGGDRPPRAASRGRGAGRGDIQVGLPSIGANIRTTGVKRPSYGSAGRPLAVFTNSFAARLPDAKIRHYDAITPETPRRLSMMIVKKLQNTVTDVFTPQAAYDGLKNMFAARELPLGPTNSREFDVTLGANGASTNKRPPKIYKVKVTRVNVINAAVLEQFVNGQYSNDNTVLTAIMCLNVVIRMQPNEQYPYNARSFFTDRETKPIGGGIVLWRGYFQSVRPGIGRLLVNVDISTGMMYKPGPLIDLCLEFFGRGGRPDPNILSPANGLPDRERLRLQKFLIGLRIDTPYTHTADRPPRLRSIKKLSTAGANASTFRNDDGQTITVARYFQQVRNRPLQYDAILCVEVGNGALIPFELCVVPPGQIMKKQLPADKTKDVLDFATKRPQDRFQSIRNGIEILSYGQSQYIRDFGMDIQTATGPLPIQARVLDPPVLKYGQGSRQLTIKPRDGAWNMIDKRLYQPKSIDRWVVVIYERQNRFPQQAAADMVRGLIAGCKSVGMTVRDESPIIKWENGQGNIAQQLRNAGNECFQKTKGGPNLIVVVLPDAGNDIYTAVKHFGDVSMGVATQCLKSNKASRAKPQYWANVCLKINPKLGGINTIPEPASVSVLMDPRNPTIIMGADVIHPAPGSEGRPSFTSVVGNVDTDAAKYIATTRAQTSRQEIIDDLKDMSKQILSSYMDYRVAIEKQPRPAAPTRLIFYRDGVSEGQFQQVLDLELPLIRGACAELNIRPKITMVVVGKRHHVRFMTQRTDQADRSGNCPAGTVVDREIGHPSEFDFFLQSHGGLLGTSRPAHYSVLFDENGFTADIMQGLSFALCHVYARATRSVSIPAPVYYADIVCARAKNHYDPSGSLNLSDSATQTEGQAENTLAAFKQNFRPLHKNMEKVMYFS